MGSHNLTLILKELNCWCLNYRGTIDSVFTDAITREDQIVKLFGVVKDILESQIKVTEGFQELYNFVKEFEETINQQIKDEIIKVFSDDEFFDAVILPKLDEAINRNLICYVSRIVKYVFFGLDDNGNFCAYIPESWNFITFDTDLSEENYGRLVLTY